MSQELEYQQEKNIEQPRVIEPQMVQPSIKQSPFTQKYSQIMNFQGECFTQPYLVQKLMDSQIRTHQSPSQKQLEILSVNTSKNYQIVDLQVKVGLYSMKIHIINIQGQSPIHKESWIAQGTFGKIFKYTSPSGQKRAVKCIQIKKNVRFEQQIFKTIQEYALLKIASAVESGPPLSSQSFDIFCYRNFKHPLIQIQAQSEQNRCCIQFEMELCEPIKIINPEQTQSLYKSLYTLHLLRFSHNDIKVDNILFSPSLNKWVYLDFGVSSSNKQKIGQCTYTHFRGTIQYSTREMAKLLAKGPGFVDLYWNDIHGLGLSINILKHPRKQQTKLKLQKAQKTNIDTHYLMLKLKYCLYYYNLPAVKNICLQIKWQTEPKKWLFYFLLELQFLPGVLKRFLGELIDDWSDIETIENINPRQMLGTVTSSLSFRNQKVQKISTIQQRFKMFKQMALILNKGMDTANVEKYIKEADQKKEQKKWEKQLENQEQALNLRSLSKEQYILIVFEFVDFVKSRKGISLKKKSIICKIFEKIIDEGKQNAESQSGNQLINDQIKEFSIVAIKFFINYLINLFIEQPDGFLTDIFPRIYLNYILLGLAKTSTLINIYQAINNNKWPLQKQIENFSLVYKNKFWYENVIYMQEIIDIFEIRKIEVKIINQLYKKNKINKQLDDYHTHTCRQEDMCYEIEDAKLAALNKKDMKKSKMNSFDQRLDNYSSILQILYRNLMNFHPNSSKFKPPETMVLQIESNRTLSPNIEKTRFLHSQIPLNLCQLYTDQLFGINGSSFCQTAEHIQQIFDYQQITQFWFIIILKNLMRFKQERDMDKIKKYFSSIQQIYTDMDHKKKSICYMISFHKIRRYCLKQFSKAIVQPQHIYFIMNKAQFFIQLIGDQFTEEQLASYLIQLNEANALAIWGYLGIIKQKQPRVLKIWETFLSKTSQLSCKVKTQVKLFAFNVFSNIFSNRISFRNNSQRLSLNKIIFQQNCPQEVLFIKLNYIEFSITKLYQLNDQDAFKVELSEYFDQLNKIMSVEEYESYFLTQQLRYHVFCLYLVYLLKSKSYQKLFEFLEKLCKRIFSYISRQTYFLWFRLKCYFYNYFLYGKSILLQEWPQFRRNFVSLSKKKKHLALQILNLCCLQIDLHYQCFVRANFIKVNDRISYRDFVILIYRAIKIFDLIRLNSRWHQIERYYRFWIILINLQFIGQPLQFVNPRLFKFLVKNHKRVIEIALRYDLRIIQNQLQYFGCKSKIEILAHFQKKKLKQRGIDTLIYLEKFKEKINNYYSQQKQQNNFCVRFKR